MMETAVSTTSNPLPPPTGVGPRARRARAACDLCRAKKVRCDSRGGRACSNCTFDEVPCVLAPRRLKRAGDGSNVLPLAPRMSVQNASSIPDQPHSTEIMPSPSHSEETTEAQPQAFPAGSSPSEQADSQSIPDPRIWTSNERESSLPPSQGSFGLSLNTGPGSSLSQPSLSAGSLPDYIKPVPSSIDPDYIQYLHKKGVLTAPDPDLRDACLRCYFQHVQPIYPIVEPEKVVAQLKGTSPGNEKMSLLLLYALMFVGGTWIEVRLVRKLGFLSRKAFRKSIHQKMRLLYDADYENDRICLIQVFVLWTFWFEGPNENKDGWHWIGLALSLSRVIGLHRASSAANMNSAMSRLRRRLWWSLATRDVISSFAISRCPRIADTDHNVPMLAIEDFEFHQMPDMLPGALPQSLHQQRTLAQICVLYVRLVSIFGRICKIAYPESGLGETSVLYSSQQLEGRDSISSNNNNLSMKNQLKLFQKHLEEWRQSVPDDLWHAADLSYDPNGPSKAELVHRGLLSMMYYATIMILHRPQMLSSNTMSYTPDPMEKPAPDPSRGMVRYAACEITRIAMDFYREDLVESLAATCITCLILASISHIFDMMSAEQAIRSDACQRLEHCKAIFHAFSEQQVGGQWALEVIHYILVRLKHRQRDQISTLTTIPRPANSSTTTTHEGHAPWSSSGESRDVDFLERSQTFQSLGVQRSTASEFINDTGLFAPSSISSLQGLSMSNLPLGSTDMLGPSLEADQLLPDNLMNFLGSDLAWLDFSNSGPENMDAMSWR